MDDAEERFLRWTLGMKWRTPGYAIREEWWKDLLRTRAGKLVRSGFTEGGMRDFSLRCEEVISVAKSNILVEV